jgi:hypothetical protein
MLIVPNFRLGDRSEKPTKGGDRLILSLRTLALRTVGFGRVQLKFKVKMAGRVTHQPFHALYSFLDNPLRLTLSDIH